MTEMFGEAWSPMSVPDLAPDDDDDNGMEDRNPCQYELICIVLGFVCRLVFFFHF